MAWVRPFGNSRADGGVCRDHCHRAI